MRTEFYVTTQDNDGREHSYKLPETDTVPDGHEITNLRPAGQFRLSSLLSPQSLAAVKSVRHK